MRQAIAAALLALAVTSGAAQAQKSGGVLRVYHRDSPASMSIIEEATNSVSIPMMAVFNNLVLYDQHVAQNRLGDIVPNLAESWSWNKDGTRLTFKLRDGVKWHDGKPFTAEDVKCTWDLLTGRSTEKLRANPRRSWWSNIAETVVDDPLQATFVLKRRQPAILALLASRSGPARSNLSSSGPTRASSWRAIPTIGSRAAPISTGSSTRSSPTAPPRSSALWRASST